VNQQKDFDYVVKMFHGVGIHIEEERLTHEEFAARNKKEGRPYMYATGWYADYPDPTILSMSSSTRRRGTYSERRYTSPVVDELSEKARRSLDLDERVALLQVSRRSAS